MALKTGDCYETLMKASEHQKTGINSVKEACVKFTVRGSYTYFYLIC